MPNIFKTPEQRKHWNTYNNEYSKRNYRTITIKLNKVTDADVIEFLLDKNGTVSAKIREMVRGGK